MEAATPPAVQVSHAGKTFKGGRRALQGVSFKVQPGERVALLGASGSGKSTLLRTLCGLETLDTDGGTVQVLGRTLQAQGRLAKDVRAQRRHIGIIFQQFNLVGRLPVLANVLTGLAADTPLWRAATGRYTTQQQARALDTLQSMGLGEQAFQRASTLSGGQQQRAAIARVLVQGAQILLADEPVASLDPESTRRVMDLLSRLNREQGLTLLVSLHHVGLARRYCDRVLALMDGQLVYDGPTRTLSPAFLRELYGTAADELLADDDTAQSGAATSTNTSPTTTPAGSPAWADAPPLRAAA